MNAQRPGTPPVPPPSVPPTPKPRRRRRKVLYILLAFGVFLLAAAALLPSVLSTSFARERILAAARGRVNAPVDATGLSFSWFGGQRIEGLRIGSPPGFPPDEDVLRVESARVETGLLGLLFSRRLALEIDRPELTVRRNKEGIFNFEALLPGKTRGPSAPEPREGKKPRRPPDLDRDLAIEVRDGRLHYRDEALPAASDVTGIEVHLAANRDEVALRSQAAVASGPHAGPPGRLSLTASAKGIPSSLADLDGQAEGTAAGIRLAPYQALLEKLAGVLPPEGPLEGTFSVSARGGNVEFSSKLNAPGGLGVQAELKGSLRPAAGGEEWRVEGSADLPIAAALPAVTRRVPGKVEIAPEARFRSPAFSFTGKLGPGRAALASLNGTARVEASGPVKCSGWTAEKLTAEVRAQDGKVTVEKGEASLGGGSAVLESLVLDLTADPPSGAAAARLEGVPANYQMTALLAYVVPFLALEDREAAFSGTIHGRIEAAGEGFARETLKKTLKGKGAVRVREGTLSSSLFFHEAAELLGIDLGEVGFSEIGSDFEIAAERITCEKVFFVGKPGSKVRNLGLKGHTTFDRRIEFGVDLAALQETVGSKRIGRVLKQAREILGDEMLPIKLAGTLSEPKLTLDLKDGALPVIDRVLGAVKDGDGGDQTKEGAAKGKEEKGDSPVGEILDLFKRKREKK